MLSDGIPWEGEAEGEGGGVWRLANGWRGDGHGRGHSPATLFFETNTWAGQRARGYGDGESDGDGGG